MNKKTTRQLIDEMNDCRDYPAYLKENRQEISSSYMKIDRALQVLLSEKQLKKAEVIARSGIEVHYGYQIFSGVKTPTRDKVIMLSFGLGLNADETQQLLKASGYQLLYGRNSRDNAILFGLMHGKTVIEMNVILFDAGLEILA